MMRKKLHEATMRVLREILYSRVRGEIGMRFMVWQGPSPILTLI